VRSGREKSTSFCPRAARLRLGKARLVQRHMGGGSELRRAVGLEGVQRWVFWSWRGLCVRRSQAGHGHQLQICWFGRGPFVCPSVMPPKGFLKLLVLSEVVNVQSSPLASLAVVQHFLDLISLGCGFFHCQPGLNMAAVFISDFFEDNGGRCP